MVTLNLREGLREVHFADRMGILCLPSLGPLLLNNLVGIRVAAVVLDYSMDPGLHEEFIQRDMLWGIRTFINNVSQAGLDGLVDSVAAYKPNKVLMYSMVTRLFCFVFSFHVRSSQES
jgi:hypothetical protein